MRYDFKCTAGHIFERAVSVAERDRQLCATCGAYAVRQPAFQSQILTIPKAFGTSKEMMMGAPGSHERDEFESKIRSGEITPAGRWV